MTLSQFERLIGRQLITEDIDNGFHCFFENVTFREAVGSCHFETMVSGAGPNKQRMREDFVQKIRGKVAQVHDGTAAYEEYPVPFGLTP